MTREDAASKGRRYLTEGRLLVRRVDKQAIDARCRGDSGEVYELGADAGGWACTCPARTDRCAHLLALKLVVLRPFGDAATPRRVPRVTTPSPSSA